MLEPTDDSTMKRRKEEKLRRKKEKKRKQRNADWDDPERHRLVVAHASAAKTTCFLPDPGSNGVGKFLLGDEKHARALKALFYLIVAKVVGGVTWGEGEEEDPRRRMYGFMPHQRRALVKAGIKIQKDGAQDEHEHEDALHRASIDLVFPRHDNNNNNNNNNKVDDQEAKTTDLVLDGSVYDALVAITAQVQALVPAPYKKFATIDQLIAAQPNLHNGASYLPAHLDFPRMDGFGVVIVTFSVRGSGVIVLMDDGDDDTEEPTSFSFELEENESYILCGDARNKCVHGVLCSENQKECRRETLNLRYGLHSAEFAKDEVDQHWPE